MEQQKNKTKEQYIVYIYNTKKNTEKNLHSQSHISYTQFSQQQSSFM